jgi:hypothetical protein
VHVLAHRLLMAESSWALLWLSLLRSPGSHEVRSNRAHPAAVVPGGRRDVDRRDRDTRDRGAGVRLDHDDPQQVGSGGPLPTADAGAHRTAGRVPGRTGVYLPGGRLPTATHSGIADTASDSAPAAAESGCTSAWMSIRAPVRRAASRAFCPSRPMASESW